MHLYGMRIEIVKKFGNLCGYSRKERDITCHQEIDGFAT